MKLVQIAAFAMMAASCAASVRAATPIGIGEFTAKVPGLPPAGIADVVIADTVFLTGTQAFQKCPMVVAATGRARAAIEAERKFQQGPEFDPASRATGTLIDPKYLIDGAITTLGETTNWEMKAHDAKSGQSLATARVTGKVDDVFVDAERAVQAILSEVCEKLTKPPTPPVKTVGAGTITMTARFDYSGTKTRDNKTSKELMSFELQGQFVLQLTAKKITATPQDDGSTQYFVAGPLASARIAKWRIGNVRTSTCMLGKLVRLGSVIGNKEEADSFFVVNTKKVGGRLAVTVEPPPWFAVNGDPKGTETSIDVITYCSREPDNNSSTAEEDGPILEAKSLDARGVEGLVGAGPGIKGVITSNGRYVIPARWSHLEYAPEDAPVEVTIELDLGPQ